jgi:carbamoyl-phosphate synthase large subunit
MGARREAGRIDYRIGHLPSAERAARVRALADDGLGAHAASLVAVATYDDDPTVLDALATSIAARQWEPVTDHRVAALRLWARGWLLQHPERDVVPASAAKPPPTPESVPVPVRRPSPPVPPVVRVPEPVPPLPPVVRVPEPVPPLPPMVRVPEPVPPLPPMVRVPGPLPPLPLMVRVPAPRSGVGPDDDEPPTERLPQLPVRTDLRPPVPAPRPRPPIPTPTTQDDR